MGRGAMLLAWVGLSACGGTKVSNSSDVTTFQQEVATATQQLGAYQAATSTMSTMADCHAAVSGYGTPMQHDLDQMMSRASSMDDRMRSTGRPSRADVGCGVQGMNDELHRHLQAACHEMDMEHDREEAAHHIAAMGNALQHMQMRAAEASAAMGPGMMDAGWPAWDGGMMDPDDHPLGCPGGPMDGGMTSGGGPGPMMDGGPVPMMDGGMRHMP